MVRSPYFSASARRTVIAKVLLKPSGRPHVSPSVFAYSIESVRYTLSASAIGGCLRISV